MSYGFEIRNSSDEVVLDSSDTTFRIIHVEECEWDYTGTFTVSNFDSNSGDYYVRPIFTLKQWSTAARSRATSEDFDFSTYLGDPIYRAIYSSAVHTKPTLSWNNTTKVMSVTAPTLAPVAVQNSGQFTQYYNVGGHYDLVFFEVK